MDILTIVTIAVGAYAASAIIVAAYYANYTWPDREDTVIFLSLLVGTLLLGLAWKWYAANAGALFDEFEAVMWSHFTDYDAPLISGFITIVFYLIAGLVVGFLYIVFWVLLPVGTIALAGISFVAFWPLARAILPLPVVALVPVSRGLGAVLIAPFILIREILYFIVKPRRTIRKIRDAVVHHDDPAVAAQVVHETISREADRARRARTWKLNLKIFASVRYFRVLADYLDSLNRVGEASSDYLRRRKRPRQ